MRPERDRDDLARRAVELAGGESEAIVRERDLALTRFTHNAIHQNVGERERSVRIRTILDGRTGVASTTDLSDAGLREVVARAREIASHAPSVPAAALRASAAAEPAAPAAYDAATAATAPAARAAAARAIFDVCERDGLWAAGYVSTASDGITIANSRGTFASYDGTSCAVNVKANGPDATGYAEFFGTALGACEPTAVAETAARKARLGANPQPVEPGAWTVLLDPAAAGELASYLDGHFSARAYEEGSSFLSGDLDVRIGTLTLADDHAHPLHAAMPFDFEGEPTRRVALVDAGRTGPVVTDAAYARRLGRPSTGHALPEPSAEGPQVRTIAIDGGSETEAQLLAGIDRGILVSRFWYIRPVDRRKTIVTGMTRDGTFLIERGKIVHGVRNMRFNQSILEALRTARCGDRQVRSGGYSYAIVAPAMRIDGFTFTSTTAF